MDRPILEDLALEIESVQKGKVEKGEQVDYGELLSHIRSNGYSRQLLIQELTDLQLKFFAKKLASGYYEEENEARKRRVEENQRRIEEKKAEVQELEHQIENDTR